MKRIEEYILKSCGYTVLLLLLLYAILAAIGVADSAIPFDRFAVLTGYGFLITGTEVLYKSLTMRTAVKVLIHYSILLAGFMLVYLVIRGLSGNVASVIFVAVAIFTLLYALLLGAVIAIKRLLGKAESKLAARPTRNKKSDEQEYHSLYGDN